MKQLFSKMLILFSPFILLSLILVIVDPYNLFHISRLFNDEAKIKCLNRSNAAAPRGNILWKTIEFRRNPSPNVILGDSRMLDIKSSVVEKKLGEKVYNLSIPGGNLKTIISLFWMAAKTTQLKNVFIQVNFNNYNAYFNADLYAPTEKVIDNRFYYFLNWNYIEDAFSIMYYSVTKDEVFVNKSYKYMENSWELSKKLIMKELGDYDYVYPEAFHEELIKISKYCKYRNINLVFVTAPDYFETHTYVKVFKLEDRYLNFKKDLFV
jgi:hypothetical protein